MTWLLVVLLAVGAFVLAAFVLRAPRKGWEAIGAALLLGIAGYAFQGSPTLPAAPKEGAETITGNPAAMVEARSIVSRSGIPPNDRWVIIADALTRNGQYADAAEILRGAVDANPKNAEAWLAMANDLVAHADWQLTPAALYAYRRASASAPDQPGAPFFLGLALAQSGRFQEARTLWTHLLAGTPPDAPWRADLVDKLGRLDRIMAAQQSAAPAR